MAHVTATLYHGSPFDIPLGVAIRPKQSAILGGAPVVYATPSRAMALCFAASVPNFDDNLSLGDVHGQLFLFEVRSGVLLRFLSRPGFLYEVDGKGFRLDPRTGMREERVKFSAARILNKTAIPNVLVALQGEPGIQVVPLR